MTASASPPPLRLAWLMWGFGAMLYLMGFFHRVAPAVMTEALMRDFNINAAALGNLSAFYFYSYVAMQIPTGIIADVWGPRRLLSLGALVAGVGAVIFALSHSLFWAGLGRLLIGGSVAVAWVGLLKLAANWFPTAMFAMVSGMALFCGVMGAVAAGTPLHLLALRFGWRGVIGASALATLAAATAIWVFVRDTPGEKGYRDYLAPADRPSVGSWSAIIGGLQEVFHYPNTLIFCFIPGALVGAVLAFSGLWGVPFLSTHYGLSTSRAAGLTSTLLVAWAVGGPVLGWWSDRMGRRKPLYVAGCAVAVAGWTAIVYLPALPLWGLTALLVITGFASGCMIINFAFAKESVPLRLAGTVSGVVNMCVMMGPMLLQPAIGWVLDRGWTGAMDAGVRRYGLNAYQSGFSMMIAWLVAALVLLVFTRETHCRQATWPPRSKKNIN
ncbi:MAG: MFS transporter [Pseudomonadota bacterium]